MHQTWHMITFKRFHFRKINYNASKQSAVIVDGAIRLAAFVNDRLPDLSPIKIDFYVTKNFLLKNYKLGKF